MGLSRTAKILLGFLLVAAAGFAWINFFNQGQVADLPQQPTPTAAVAPTAPAPVVAAPLVAAPEAGGNVSEATTPTEGEAATAEASAGDATSEAGGEVEATQASETEAAAAAAVTTPVQPDVAPAVIVTQAPTVVTRDLIVGDLPFLVTAPPAPQVEATADDPAGASRPPGTQRTSVNPFSPIIVQAPAPAPGPVVAQSEPEVVEIVTDAGAPASGPVITEVSASSAAATAAPQPPPPPAAPAPRTIAPATSATSALPRPLPSGTLPVTPEILREARAPEQTAETPAPVDLGTLAAIRVPDEPEVPEPLPATESGTADTTSVSAPEVLGTDRPNEPAATAVEAQPSETSVTPTPTPALPLAIGGDPLSRYLRDNNVRFTGTVLGPLSVGVFRSAQFSEPVVLTLGQAIPDTDIILTDLLGYEARFSLGDVTQTLSLDLRR